MKRLAFILFLLLFASLVPAVQAQKAVKVRPTFQCVDVNTNGTYTAHFGYANTGKTAVTIPIGPSNRFNPAPADRGQPAEFVKGQHPHVILVTFNQGTNLSWTLGTKTVKANITILCSTLAQPPVAPTGVSAQGTSQTEIQITWNASQNAASYNIYMLSGPNQWSKIGNTANTHFDHSGLTCGTLISYKVSALNSISSESALSDPAADGTTESCPLPGASNLSATASGDGQINLDWTETSDTTLYRLETFSDPNWVVLTLTTATDYVHAGLMCGTEYKYRVASINAYGETLSNEDTAITDACNLEKPFVTATPMSESQIDLSWTAGASALSYDVEFSTDGTNWTLLADDAVNTTYSHTGLACGTAYWYRVTNNTTATVSNPVTTRTVTCELVKNGGFETRGLAPWKKQKLARDRVVCNTTTRSVTPFGACALQMRGLLTTRASTITQTNSVTQYTISSGETLNFSLQAKTRGGTVKASLLIFYLDGSRKSVPLVSVPKRTIGTGFEPFAKTVTVPVSGTSSTSVSKIRVILRYKGSTSAARAFVDDISLKYDQ